ncbi:ATP-binding protein [Dokdonia ponticola]|uniref:histidine kinase n=1 Tax=Dokdonia ponticola TaxID=2041041 RepID=A0ABV9HV04_9FLAO
MGKAIKLYEILHKDALWLLIRLIICILLPGHFITAQNIATSDQHFTPTEIWESGLPYIENYTSGDYKSSPQNWAFTEGSNGFLYAANTNGILQYDGATWTTIALPNKSLVRSIAASENGKIYVGGVNELGYLAPDALGKMQFYSLKSFLQEEYQEFRDVWSIIFIDDLVYFQFANALFRWDGKAFYAWKPKEFFGSAFKVNNEVYIDSKGDGILKIEGDALNVIPGGELVTNDRAKTEGILSHKDNNLLLINAQFGMSILDGEKIVRFNPESNAVFEKNRIYKSIRLSNGDYAMATSTRGLYIVNGETGAIKKRIGKKQGLISDVLFSVYEDRFGAIWVGSDNGISRIDWASPFRSFNEFNGLPERVRSAMYHKGRLFVDSKGLYELVKNNPAKEINTPSFIKIEGIENKITSMLPYEDDILAFNSQFTFIIDTKNTLQFKERHSAFTFTSVLRSAIDPSKIYVGGLEGSLFECYYKNKQWVVPTEPSIKINGSIESITETSDGDLWLRTNYHGLYFAEKQPQKTTTEKRFTLKQFDTLSGLPTMSYNFLYKFDDQIHVTAADGMYRFNKTAQIFEKDSLLNDQYPSEVNAYGYMGRSADGTIWQTVRKGFENKLYTLGEDTLTEVSEFNLYTDFDIYSMEFLDDIPLLLGPNGMLAFNPNQKRPSKKQFNAHIRKVLVNADSLVYAGRYAFAKAIKEIPFSHAQNNLNFEYALPYFNSAQNNSYQSYLEGYDTSWSPWSTETKRNYTNIPAGDYTFKVRSKNVYNEEGDEDSYRFSIQPPWYGNWLAYLIYILTLVALVWLMSRWRSKELQKKNERLEATISERTKEIQQKNTVLNHQTEQLVELNEAKTRLYSNISHEFRTPLTVILGMTDTLRTNYQNKVNESPEKSLEMIKRNGKNLLHLVNELLDLAKVESGSMELDLTQIDVVPFIKYFSESFHSLAESKNINLTVYSEIDSVEMDIDVNKLASIISNLLSNAIKFTAPHGKIIVHLNTLKQASGNALIIKVQDNGRGLDERDMSHLFDRFYQAPNASSEQQLGTGIGLSLTKEFVDLMQGEITVESTLEKGSTFTVQIPITNNVSKIKEVQLSKTVLENLSNEQEVVIAPTYATELSLEKNTSDLPLVLIIEDNRDVAQYLKVCLREKYQTIHATDGNSGIQMAYDNIPDIIISDVMMPNKNGYEVCATLKADESTDHIPIILLTAKVSEEDRLTGLTHGADAYLAKPFNQEELFTRLNQLILVRKKLINKLEQYGFSSVLSEKVENPQTKFVQQVIKVVLTHLEDVNFGPTLLAEKMHLSESQIYRKLKSITDKSTAVFIRSVRLQKAKELIQTSNKTISEIAYEVGFNDPSWFSRAFKVEFGTSPRDYFK